MPPSPHYSSGTEHHLVGSQPAEEGGIKFFITSPPPCPLSGATASLL